MGAFGSACGTSGAQCYGYDLDGNRVSKDDDGVLTTYA
jgi:hypothetical protein